MRAALTLVAIIAAATAQPTSTDLQRAHTRFPREAYRSDSRIGIPSTLNGHLQGTPGLATAACAEFSLSDVIDVKRTIHAARSAEFQEIYAEKNDGRRLGTFGRFMAEINELEAQWAQAKIVIETNPELHSHARDAMCREAVMWFIHHTTQQTKEQLSQFIVLPLLPQASTVLPPSNNASAHTLVSNAVAQSNLCFQCHHTDPEPTPAPAPCVTGARGGSCPVWPIEFSAPFTLYSKSLFLPHITASPSDFYYKYDSTIKAQLVDYKKNCFPGTITKGGKASEPCKLLFDDTGIYLSQPANKVACCKFADKVGAVPPAFLNSFTYAGKENAPDMYGNNVMCDKWSGADGFAYWTAAAPYNGTDGRSFPANHDVVFQDGPTGVTWRWGEFSLAPVDVSLLKQSSLGTPEQCATSCHLFWSAGEIEQASRAPEVRAYLSRSDPLVQPLV